MKTNTLPIILVLIILIAGLFLLVRNRDDSNNKLRNVDTMGSTINLPISSSEVSYYGSVNGWYAKPQASGTYPGIVVIHEWWGLNDNIKKSAEELAKDGYNVLAVDLYNGVVATTSAQARLLTTNLNKADALDNLKSAVKYLRDQGSGKIASLGWCFGGGQSLSLSLSDEDLDATVIYYGQLVTDKTQLINIDEPVLGIFGEIDTSISTTTVSQFETALGELGKQKEIYIYPGVGHAFANPTGMNYAPEATQDAWEKTLTFLNKYLK